MKHIRIIVGGTGSGKDYLVKELNKSIRGNSLVKSFTTREKRENEDDTKYIFNKDFTIDDVIEMEYFGNNYYGICKQDFIDKLNTKDDISLIVEPSGVRNVLLWLKNNPHKIKHKFHLEIVFLNIPRFERFNNILLSSNLDMTVSLDRIVRGGDTVDRTFSNMKNEIESLIGNIDKAKLPFLILNGVKHIIELTNRDEIARYLRISMGKRK